jgi:hypothetical protein
VRFPGRAIFNWHLSRPSIPRAQPAKNGRNESANTPRIFTTLFFEEQDKSVLQKPASTMFKENDMGYSIHFKRASLKQIFTLAARDYAQNCYLDARDIIEAETPKCAIAHLTPGPPAIWVLGAELTDSIEKKLKALPFVESIETDDEARKKSRPSSKDVGDKIQRVADRIVYGRGY